MCLIFLYHVAFDLPVPTLGFCTFFPSGLVASILSMFGGVGIRIVPVGAPPLPLPCNSSCKNGTNRSLEVWSNLLVKPSVSLEERFLIAALFLMVIGFICFCISSWISFLVNYVFLKFIHFPCVFNVLASSCGWRPSSATVLSVETPSSRSLDGFLPPSFPVSVLQGSLFCWLVQSPLCTTWSSCGVFVFFFLLSLPLFTTCFEFSNYSFSNWSRTLSSWVSSLPSFPILALTPKAMNFPQNMSFAAFYEFGHGAIAVSFTSGYFLISIGISSFTHEYCEWVGFFLTFYWDIRTEKYIYHQHTAWWMFTNWTSQ